MTRVPRSWRLREAQSAEYVIKWDYTCRTRYYTCRNESAAQVACFTKLRRAWESRIVYFVGLNNNVVCGSREAEGSTWEDCAVTTQIINNCFGISSTFLLFPIMINSPNSINVSQRAVQGRWILIFASVISHVRVMLFWVKHAVYAKNKPVIETINLSRSPGFRIYGEAARKDSGALAPRATRRSCYPLSTRREKKQVWRWTGVHLIWLLFFLPCCTSVFA